MGRGDHEDPRTIQWRSPRLQVVERLDPRKRALVAQLGMKSRTGWHNGPDDKHNICPWWSCQSLVHVLFWECVQQPNSQRAVSACRAVGMAARAVVCFICRLLGIGWQACCAPVSLCCIRVLVLDGPGYLLSI